MIFAQLAAAVPSSPIELILASSGVTLSVLAVLAILSTVLPSVFFLMVLVRLGPVRTAIISTIEPFLTALLAAVALGQGMTPPTLVGGALIVSAVALLQFKRDRVA